MRARFLAVAVCSTMGILGGIGLLSAAPSVLETTPAADAVDVSQDTGVQILVDAGGLGLDVADTSLEISVDGSPPVALAFVLTGDASIEHFPIERLPANAAITLHVTLFDATGASSEYEWSFTTGATAVPMPAAEVLGYDLVGDDSLRLTLAGEPKPITIEASLDLELWQEQMVTNRDVVWLPKTVGVSFYRATVLGTHLTWVFAGSADPPPAGSSASGSTSLSLNGDQVSLTLSAGDLSSPVTSLVLMMRDADGDLVQQANLKALIPSLIGELSGTADGSFRLPFGISPPGDYLELILGTENYPDGELDFSDLPPSNSLPVDTPEATGNGQEPRVRGGDADAAAVYRIDPATRDRPGLEAGSDENPVSPAGDVVVSNGEKRIDRVDLRIAGRGQIHFELRRRYRSQLAYDGPLGYGWDFSYNETLFVQGNGDVIRSDGQGGQARSGLAGGATFAAPAGQFRDLCVRKGTAATPCASPTASDGPITLRVA